MEFINKQEFRYILGAGAFTVIFFLFLMPYLISVITNPFLQFLVFNIGILAILVIFLKSFSSKTGVNVGASLAILLVYLALDIPTPEWHVMTTGELVAGATAGRATTDYIVGFVYSNLGIHGTFLYIMVYIITPLLLLLLASKLFPNFVRKL